MNERTMKCVWGDVEIFWRCTYVSKSNFWGQGFRKLEHCRHTDRHTSRHTDRRDWKHHRAAFVGGKNRWQM